MTTNTTRRPILGRSLSFAWLALLRAKPTAATRRKKARSGTGWGEIDRRHGGGTTRAPTVLSPSEAQLLAAIERRNEILASPAARRCPDLARELTKTSLPAADVLALLAPHAAEVAVIEGWDRAFASLRR